MLTLIDNFDSFTNNLVHVFLALNVEVQVVRYDELQEVSSRMLVIGPGPGSPADVPRCQELIRSLDIPILGICLGHQCIAQAFGGKVVRASFPMHGKKSAIIHEASGLFAKMEQGFAVGRYHSLVVERSSLPECLEITAKTMAGEIMAIRHKTRPIYGLQFHPESVLTPQGQQMLKNFLNMETQNEKQSEKLYPMPAGLTR